MAFSVGEEELSGIDTAPLVGHLAAWNYFKSVDTPENKEFIKKFREFTKNPKRVTNDPMELTILASICGNYKTKTRICQGSSKAK